MVAHPDGRSSRRCRRSTTGRRASTRSLPTTAWARARAARRAGAAPRTWQGLVARPAERRFPAECRATPVCGARCRRGARSPIAAASGEHGRRVFGAAAAAVKRGRGAGTCRRARRRDSGAGSRSRSAGWCIMEQAARVAVGDEPGPERHHLHASAPAPRRRTAESALSTRTSLSTSDGSGGRHAYTRTTASRDLTQVMCSLSL